MEPYKSRRSMRREEAKEREKQKALEKNNADKRKKEIKDGLALLESWMLPKTEQVIASYKSAALRARGLEAEIMEIAQVALNGASKDSADAIKTLQYVKDSIDVVHDLHYANGDLKFEAEHEKEKTDMIITKLRKENATLCDSVKPLEKRVEQFDKAREYYRQNRDNLKARHQRQLDFWVNAECRAKNELSEQKLKLREVLVRLNVFQQGSKDDKARLEEQALKLSALESNLETALAANKRREEEFAKVSTQLKDHEHSSNESRMHLVNEKNLRIADLESKLIRAQEIEAQLADAHMTISDLRSGAAHHDTAAIHLVKADAKPNDGHQRSMEGVDNLQGSLSQHRDSNMPITETDVAETRDRFSQTYGKEKDSTRSDERSKDSSKSHTSTKTREVSQNREFVDVKSNLRKTPPEEEQLSPSSSTPSHGLAEICEKETQLGRQLKKARDWLNAWKGSTAGKQQSTTEIKKVVAIKAQKDVVDTISLDVPGHQSIVDTKESIATADKVAEAGTVHPDHEASHMSQPQNASLFVQSRFPDISPTSASSSIIGVASESGNHRTLEQTKSGTSPISKNVRTIAQKRRERAKKAATPDPAKYTDGTEMRNADWAAVRKKFSNIKKTDTHDPQGLSQEVREFIDELSYNRNRSESSKVVPKIDELSYESSRSAPGTLVSQIDELSYHRSRFESGKLWHTLSFYFRTVCGLLLTTVLKSLYGVLYSPKSFLLSAGHLGRSGKWLKVLLLFLLYISVVEAIAAIPPASNSLGPVTYLIRRATWEYFAQYNPCYNGSGCALPG